MFDQRLLYKGYIDHYFGEQLPNKHGLLLLSDDANEHENCRPLLRSERNVALVYEADHASGIERVGIENLLILLATRATGRCITRPCDNLDRRSVCTRNRTGRTGGARRTGRTGGAGRPSLTLGGGSLCPQAA